MATEQNEIIQYVPFKSFVQPSFWHALTDLKLNVDKLDESSKQIYGRYTYCEEIDTVFEVDGTSFNKNPEEEQLYHNLTGVIYNKNTIEDFKNIDKVELLNNFGKEMWNNVKINWISNPTSLLNFYILSFADLKKFHYYYWFAFPAPSQPAVYLKESSKPITELFSNKDIEHLHLGFKSLDKIHKSFFIVFKTDIISVKPITDLFNSKKVELDFNNIYFSFIDPSNEDNPGWPLRLFLAALLDHSPNIRNTEIKVIGLRSKVNGDICNSRIFYIKVPENIQATDTAGWVGWERNDKGYFGPKFANMSASMDPLRLADTSSDLNIKLMKWRLVPDIDVDVMKNTKCLLLGAGTLGCHVARNLLAWGFRHITFLDNSKVSYSNPTRQVLFNFEDCLNGGKMKAEAAAENLKLILPTVKSKGLTIHIPMPGHPIGDLLKEETLFNIKVITKTILEHDAIFLLLDTREARWLPTLIAAQYGKIVINAALGFDSYLVMRHGESSKESCDETSLNSTFIPGNQLGCYFCNDVTSPGNSLRERTLDQQCTVSRGGVAAIAAALAVEVLVALLQHPLRIKAPAVYNLTSESDLPPEMSGVLGPVPHSIRGFLHSYQTILPTYAKFKQCIACSEIVLKKYMEEGNNFLFEVFKSGKHLEEVTGLTEMQIAAELTEVLTFSDEDSD